MAQTLIKIDYKGERCNGIYYVSDEEFGSSITKENAPKGTLHKFVIRQTVTIPGIGKKTAKKTITKSGITFYKALQDVIKDREPFRENIKNDLLGVTDDKAEQNALAVLTVDELWKKHYAHKIRPLTKAEIEKQKEAELEGKKKIKDKTRWSGAYAYTMQSDYKRLVKPYIGHMRAMQVKKKHIKECIEEAKGRGLKARSEYSIISVVRPMYETWIDDEDLDKNNPASKIELTELDNEVDVDLSWEQIEKLYSVLYTWKDDRYRQFFIWLSTGRRNGETLMLDTAHIDGKYYTIIAENNKAKKDMIYRVPDGVKIKEFKDYIPPKPKKGYKHKVPITQFVHTSPRNNDIQLQPVTVNSIWKNVRKLSDLPTIRKHDLRHILGTKLADGGVPLEIRSMVLGHTSSNITDRYKTDTKEGADLKHKAVTFFLEKVFNKIDRKMLWDEYIVKENTIQSVKDKNEQL